MICPNNTRAGLVLGLWSDLNQKCIPEVINEKSKRTKTHVITRYFVRWPQTWRREGTFPFVTPIKAIKLDVGAYKKLPVALKL